MSESGEYRRIIRLCAIASLIAVIYVILTYGQTCLHSDSTGVLRLYNSIKANRSLYPRSWNTANGEIYIFHNATVACFTSLLIHNPIIARVVSSAISIIIAYFCLVWFSNNCLKSDSWMYATTFTLLFLCSANSRDMILFQAAYVAPIICFTVCFATSYRIILCEESGWITKVVQLGLLATMSIEGIRYIAEYIIPVICSFGIIAVIKVIKHEDAGKKSILKILGYIVIPSAVGYFIYKYISQTHSMNNSVSNGFEIVNSFALLMQNAKLYFLNIIAAFGFSKSNALGYNIIALLVAFLICVALPLIRLSNFKSCIEAEKTFLLFGMVHNVMLIGIALLLSKVEERYLLSSIYICIIISSQCLVDILKQNKKISNILVLVFLALSVFQMILLVKTTYGWKDNLASQKDFCQQLVDKGITKGYATYWNAYTNEAYSENKISFGAIKPSERKLEKYYWLVDDSAFEKKEGKSCVILTRKENKLYGDAVYIQCGEPSDDFIYKNAYVYDFYKDRYYRTDLVVYIFDEDVSDTLSDGLRDGVAYVKDMDFNYHGEKTEDAIYFGSGGLIRGPYSSIEPGNYHVIVEGANLYLCDFDIVSQENQDGIEYTEPISSNRIECDLTISKPLDDLEFRIYNPNKKVVEFYYIALLKIEKR